MSSMLFKPSANQKTGCFKQMINVEAAEASSPSSWGNGDELGALKSACHSQPSVFMAKLKVGQRRQVCVEVLTNHFHFGSLPGSSCGGGDVVLGLRMRRQAPAQTAPLKNVTRQYLESRRRSRRVIIHTKSLVQGHDTDQQNSNDDKRRRDKRASVMSTERRGGRRGRTCVKRGR